MKRIFSTILVLFISINLLGGAYLSFFHVSSDDNNITLNWQTAQEINLKEYSVERRSSTGPFTEIAKISAKGNNSVYSYVDENAFKTTNSLYVYRLKIIDNDNSYTYSQEVAVSHSTTDIKRTWGSVKALFR
jgi:hypothetical protein